ncbi:hypothetical protein ACSTIK_00015, partial [Vibrio parahaemolyticus]
LRDAHYPGAKRLGHGKGYKYPHDSEIGIVAQQYLPTNCADGGTTSPRPTVRSATSRHAWRRSVASSTA